MHDGIPAYGYWGIAFLNAAIFILFAYSFAKPLSKRDWRSFGAFSAFIVALFAEMYGFPLTIYLSSGWLASHYPGVNFMSHDAGHLLYTLLGFKGDAHWNPLHLLSLLVIIGGMVLLGAAWPVLYRAQRHHTLATTGPYANVRHPQYVGFVLIMVGFLIQWPTLPTLVLFPILVFMYWRLAKHEEAESRQQFGEAWDKYVADVPAFIPSWKAHRPQSA